MAAEIIAFVALLLTVMGGLWKMASLITKVQTTVEFIQKDLESNTRITAECATRISRLEGANTNHYTGTDYGRR